jgi:hypothetical protein
VRTFAAEAWLFQLSKHLPDMTTAPVCRPPTLDQWLLDLEEVVALYRVDVAVVVRQLAKCSESETDDMATEALSRQTLAVWTAYCIADMHVRLDVPALQDYGVSLKRSDLSGLVLSDALAVQTLQRVASYIDCRCESSYCPVCSLLLDRFVFWL